MGPGLAVGVLCGLLSQVPEEADSLEVVFRRVQRRLTEQVLVDRVSVLAHDRAVAVLVTRVAEGRVTLNDTRGRLRELEIEKQVLQSIRLEDLTELARDRHLERLATLDRARTELRRTEATTCRALIETIAELKGRVEGKIDTLEAAAQSCRAATAPEWCHGMDEALSSFQALSRALANELRLNELRCPR